MNKVTTFAKKLLPSNSGEDGRQQWGSRTSYILASMGGAVGFGNLLRFPSQVFNNNGIQWFIPYLIAITMLAIPVLVLEVAIGQVYRSGSVIAYNGLEKRTRGVGLAMICVGFMVCVYYVPMLAWVLKYFRNSFQSPLPWAGRVQEFYRDYVTADVRPIPGSFSGDGSVTSYASYPGTAFLGETVGWTAFAWFLVWLCLYNGVAVTGKVVYFTMGLPIVVVIILVGRGTSLPNAVDGIKLYFGEFNGDQLATGQLWQAAIGQVFYSTGIGLGYFTAYASYNTKFANAVQDSVIICLSNATFETIAAFAVFGVVGFMGLNPNDPDLPEVGTFTLGFITFPEALAQMPAAPFWSIVFFFTLFFLGLSSSFVMLDSLITMICDVQNKLSHIAVATIVTLASFLLSLMYCTEFGYDLLNAVDAWINNALLLFTVWSECVSATTVYRYGDVVGQVGWPAFASYNFGYIGGMILGPAVAQSVSPGAGAGVGFGIYIVGTVVSVLIAKTPDSIAPKFWGRNAMLSKLWWMGAYSGNQLRRDLNVVVAVGKNWSIPSFWAVILRYISAPTLAIIFSFAYPTFHPVRNDPLQIFGFCVAHLAIFAAILAFILPAWLSFLIPPQRREEGNRTYAPQVLLGDDDINVSKGVPVEEGLYQSESGNENDEYNGKKEESVVR